MRIRCERRIAPAASTIGVAPWRSSTSTWRVASEMNTAGSAAWIASAQRAPRTASSDAAAAPLIVTTSEPVTSGTSRPPTPAAISQICATSASRSSWRDPAGTISTVPASLGGSTGGERSA